MPPRPAIDMRFISATRRLARRGLTDAEIVRALQPLSARLRKAPPSYSAVRRIAGPVRRHEPNPYVDEAVTQLLAGRLPNFYYVDSVLQRQAEGRPRTR
jgi:hypothetical protein